MMHFVKDCVAQLVALEEKSKDHLSHKASHISTLNNAETGKCLAKITNYCLEMTMKLNQHL